MTILSPSIWARRELAYRTGEPVEDIARREDVLPGAVNSWAGHKGWNRFGPTSRILQLRLEMALSQVEAALDADDTEDAARRLRTLASYVRLKRLTDALEDTPCEGEAGHDTTNSADPGVDTRSIEDIRRELDEILPRAAGT